MVAGVTIPPAWWFVEALNHLAVVVAQNSLTKRPFSVRVVQDFGLSLGIAPGQWVDIATAAGVIRIDSVPER